MPKTAHADIDSEKDKIARVAGCTDFNDFSSKVLSGTKYKVSNFGTTTVSFGGYEWWPVYAEAYGTDVKLTLWLKTAIDGKYTFSDGTYGTNTTYASNNYYYSWIRAAINVGTTKITVDGKEEAAYYGTWNGGSGQPTCFYSGSNYAQSPTAVCAPEDFPYFANLVGNSFIIKGGDYGDDLWLPSLEEVKSGGSWGCTSIQWYFTGTRYCWTRSPNPPNTYTACWFQASGTTGSSNVIETYSVRPAINVNLTAIDDTTDFAVNPDPTKLVVVTDPELLTGGTSANEKYDGSKKTFTIENVSSDVTSSLGSGLTEESYDSSTGTLIVSAINAGTYTVTVALKNSSTTVWASGGTADKTITITINKAKPNITVSAPTESFELSSKMPEISYESDVSGTLSWDKTPTAGTNTYTWTFTPTDTDNYEIVTGSVSLTFIDPDDTEDPNNPGGGGTTDPTDPSNPGGSGTTDPTDPSNPGGSGTTDPTDPTSPGGSGTTDPTDPSNPGGSGTTDPTDPSNPGGSGTTDPTDPSNPGGSGTTDPNNPGGSGTTDPTDPSNPGGSGTTNPTDPSNPGSNDGNEDGNGGGPTDSDNGKSGAGSFFNGVKNFFAKNWWWLLIALAALLLLIIIIVVASRRRKDDDEKKAKKEEKAKREEEQIRALQATPVAAASMVAAQPVVQPVVQPQPVIQQVPVQDNSAILRLEMELAEMRAKLAAAQQPNYAPPQYAPATAPAPQPTAAPAWDSATLVRLEAQLNAMQAEQRARYEAEQHAEQNSALKTELALKNELEMMKLRLDQRQPSVPQQIVQGGGVSVDGELEKIVAVATAVWRNMQAQSNAEVKPAEKGKAYPPDAVVTTTTTVDTTKNKPIARAREKQSEFTDVDGFYDKYE